MPIECQSGDLRLALAPETGGAIAALTWRGEDVLRPVRDPRLAAQHGRAVAAYPLIPYANRIAWGRFAFCGRHFELARNFGDHPHTIHGNAWMRAWCVAESSPDRVRLSLDHTPPDDPPEQWPFAYRAEQLFELGPDGLRITLSVQNRDTGPWPAGLGLHPYVARTADTTLRFKAASLWTTGADSLPVDRVAISGAADFTDPRRLGGGEIDACYAGWHGTACISLPESGATLVMTSGGPIGHLQVYTPGHRDFLGLEPVSNMPDAINRMMEVSDQGLLVLAPGETLRAAATLAILDGRGGERIW